MSREWSIISGNLIVDNSAAFMDGSGGYHGNVRWTYVHVVNGVIIDPHVGFYRNPPPNAKCRWSTDDGKRQPNNFDKAHMNMPPRQLWLWDDNELQTVADKYKQTFWQDLKSLTRPNTFHDLYEFFDSATLWENGAYNLWNLMNMLVTEAHQRWPAVLAYWKKEIDEWVHALLYEWPGCEDNQNALKQWNGHSDPLVDVRFNDNYNANVALDELSPQEAAMLRDELINSFYKLTGQVPRLPPRTYPYLPRDFDVATMPPVQSVAASSEAPPAKVSPSKAIVIVRSGDSKSPTGASPISMAETSGCNEETQGSQHPSPPTSLASIPEEAGADVEPPTPATEKLETSDEPTAEIVAPQTVTEPASVQPDNAVRDLCQGSNDSIDAVSCNPSTCRLEESGRQMSVHSAPDEESESMLGAVVGVSPARSHKPQPSSAKSPNQKDEQGPWRLHRKSPPRNVPCPVYNPPVAPLPRSTMPDPPPPSTYLAPGMSSYMSSQPPHPNVVQGLSGPLSHPPQNGFVPFATPPSAGAPSAGPFMGPWMPFHNHLPTHRGPIGQQQQFISQGLPPQAMSVQPPYQPVQQPGVPDQQARYNNNGALAGSQKSLRRNSTVSNGSRKVRDDPIHGAIYSLRDPRSGPRRNSNTELGHRPSSVTGQCKNGQLIGHFNELFNQTFAECPCKNCDAASRSIYIKYLSPKCQSRQIQDTLSSYFGYLSVESVMPRRFCKEALVMFRQESDAIRAVSDFENSQDKSLRGLAVAADVWYAIFSKHYYCRNNTHRKPSMDSHNDRSRRSSLLGASWRNTPHFLAGEPMMVPPQFPVGHGMPMVPIPPTGAQRALWEPTDNPKRGSMEPTFPQSKPDKRQPRSKPSSPQKVDSRTEELRTKEDWRSKPPSEEAIEHDVEEDTAPADVASNHSSQGSRSIVVCLPSPQKACERTGEVDSTAETTQGEMVTLNKVQGGVRASEDTASQTTDIAEAANETTVTTTPTAAASAPAPASAPEEIAEQSPVSEKEGTTKEVKPLAPKASEVQTLSRASGRQYQKKKNKRATILPSMAESSDDPAAGPSDHGYRKTTNDLSSAVEAVWLPLETGTVVRHKQPRATLLSSWTAETCKAEAETTTDTNRAAFDMAPDDRLRELTALMQEEQKMGAMKMLDAALDHIREGKGKENTRTIILEESKQPPKKKTRPQKQEAKTQGGLSPGRATLADDQPRRGPSPSSTSSQHTTRTGPSSRGPSPAMMQNPDEPTSSRSSTTKPKNKKNQRYKNRKATHNSSEHSEGQAKSDEVLQAKPDQAARPETTMPKESGIEKRPVPEAIATTCETRSANEASRGAGASQSVPMTTGKEAYRAHNGGSLRMKKNRSPEKGSHPQHAPLHERNSMLSGASTMPTIFEPSSNQLHHDPSLFQDQKSVIDELRRLGVTPNIQPNAYMPSSGVPHAWTGAAKKTEDPFTTGQAHTTSKPWIKDHAIRTPREASKKQHNHNDRSPTPSPNKKTQHPETKTELSATAPTFVSSRPTSPVPPSKKLDPSVRPFASSLPPSPAQSIVQGRDPPAAAEHAAKNQANKKTLFPGSSTGVDKRFVTPADQIVDPLTLKQPGAPAREKKTGFSSSGGAGDGPTTDPTNTNHMRAVAEKQPPQPPPPPPPQPSAAGPKDTSSTASQRQGEAHDKKASNRNTKKQAVVEDTATKKTTIAHLFTEPAPPLNRDHFPTLGEAAAAAAETTSSKMKRATSLVAKRSSPSGRTTTAAGVSPEASKPAQQSTVAREDSNKVAKKKQPGDKALEGAADQGEWQLVVGAKKNNNQNPAARAPSGFGGGGGVGWSGSWRRRVLGRNTASFEERKGG